MFDIDGVMTNGDLLCTPEGEIWRSMNAKDGYAIQSILKNGYNIAIITSGRQHGVLRRLEKIGVNLIFKDAWEKRKDTNRICERQAFEFGTCTYIWVMIFPIIK